MDELAGRAKAGVVTEYPCDNAECRSRTKFTLGLRGPLFLGCTKFPACRGKAFRGQDWPKHSAFKFKRGRASASWAQI